MSRSKRYPTRYRVGILGGKDIYLHPQLGLSIEWDHRLRGMAPRELAAWFRQEQDVRMLAELEKLFPEEEPDNLASHPHYERCGDS